MHFGCITLEKKDHKAGINYTPRENSVCYENFGLWWTKKVGKGVLQRIVFKKRKEKSDTCFASVWNI